MKKFTIYFLLAATYFSVSAQDPGTIEFISNELASIIKKDAKVEVIADGFQFTEGPLWLEKEKMLLVSDIPANTIFKWSESKGKELYVQPAGYTDTTKRGGFMGPNGLILASDGKLLICQHGDGRIAKMDAPISSPKPKFITVAGSYEGKRLNSPNDLFLTRKGDLYFTDPSYGFEKGPNDPKKELSFNGVYKLSADGKLTLLLDSIDQPNGIGILPDGKTLIVANSHARKRRWYSYQLDNNGLIKSGKILHDASNDPLPGLCDGFKFDKAGNMFAAGPGGIWIFTKAGMLVGKIKVNGASNCALSPDGKIIYITAVERLLRVKLR